MGFGALIFVCLVIAGLWLLAVYGWFESRYIWNGGVCVLTGHRWQVFEIDGDLVLDDDHGHRVCVRGVVVHPAITRALRQQRRVGRG